MKKPNRSEEKLQNKRILELTKDLKLQWTNQNKYLKGSSLRKKEGMRV